MRSVATLNIINARILTLAGSDVPRRGRALADLGVIERGFVRVEDTRIAAVGAGAAAWEALKGDQTESTLDAGSACVAQGEARCKEILSTDFNYGTGPRRPS